MIKALHDLKVYQLAMTLAEAIHGQTLRFPSYARVELGRQMRLSADSIPANIAEGYGRQKYPGEFRRFLVNALGSCTELGCQLELALRHLYFDQAVYDGLAEQQGHLGRALNVLLQRWR